MKGQDGCLGRFDAQKDNTIDARKIYIFWVPHDAHFLSLVYRNLNIFEIKLSQS